MDNQQLQLVTLATEINLLHESAQQAAMTAVQYAAKCGEKLIQAKAACNHGEWLPWLEANCRVNKRQSQKYMRLASEMPCLIDANAQSTAHFTGIEAAIAYLSAPDEVKTQIDESPEPVTEKQINELKKQYQALEDEKRLFENRSEEWRKQYLAEREAKRALEANPVKVQVEVIPPDYEATKQAANELALQLAKAKAEAKAENEAAKILALYIFRNND